MTTSAAQSTDEPPVPLPPRVIAAIDGQTWAAEDGHPRRWWVLAVLAGVGFMAQLDLFIVNIAVPAIGRSFHGASLSSISWVLNAYAIVFAALLVPAGRLADHFGRKRFLLAGVAIFTLASALCAIAPTLGVLIAGRALQAVGSAIIVPTSLGLLLPSFSKRQHGLVVGIWSGVAAVAASSGPPVGGLLVGPSWRWIFVINVPIGLAVMLVGRRVLPEVRAAAGSVLPNATSILAVLGSITLLILATVQGPTWGWTSQWTIGAFVLAGIGTAFTVLRAIQHPRSLIEASLFKNREFTSSAIALFLFFVAFAIWLLITVLFLQDAWHYSPLRSGFALAPGPLTAALFAVNSGRITRQFGRIAPAVTGAFLVTASAGLWLTMIPAHSEYLATFLPGMILGGAGSGLAQAPLFAAASTLPIDRATTGSAVLSMSRQVGSAVGVAILVALVGTTHSHGLTIYHRAWIVEIGASLSAAAAIFLLRQRNRALHLVEQAA